MTATVLLAAEATHVERDTNPELWGIGALVILFALLLITVTFGKGRPHE